MNLTEAALQIDSQLGPSEPQALAFGVDIGAAGAGPRAGVLTLPRAVVETPTFMPVGTQGSVKAMTPGELADVGYRLILANTYHLHIRPGEELIARAGGLGGFTGWTHAFLTDSGGFQVYSLAGLRRITDEGVEFQSHVDGSLCRFTPESVILTQQQLGADIIMTLDECPPYPCSRDAAQLAMTRTHNWARRCAAEYHAVSGRSSRGQPQALFAITQGGVYRDLREESARTLSDLGLPGYAIGGLAVGEDAAARRDAIAWCTDILPANKPRYLMGVGAPEDILDAVELGIDMFDCVLPTRNARNAQVFTSSGRLNLRNARFADDFAPIDAACGCRVCTVHSRAYIRHLFHAREILGPRLATYHNLYFYARFMTAIRSAITAGRLADFRADFLARYSDEPS